MSFACPCCQQPASLAIVASIELPPDTRSDEIALQVLACEACEFRALAIYEESRRGALDSEAWEHTGYAVPGSLLERVKESIQRCPNQADSSCGCPSHRGLNRVDRVGRWQAPEGIAGTQSFAMRLSVPRA
jgi:hypothetical protein